jgi:lantibiotic modifying enzyme
VAAARRIGDRLADLAVRADHRASWFGLDSVQACWQVNPLRWDLYSGFPGVALFLAQLTAVTGDRSYAGLCRDALWSLPGVVDQFAGMAPQQRTALLGPAALGGVVGTC